MNGRRCATCDLPIGARRLEAIPTAQRCAHCASLDDVPLTTGFMTWEHKTAPSIVIGPAAETLRSYDRKR